jgi:hypothetical protein
MRVIEQLVHHFWARGALTREEALYLVQHGFAREEDLPGLIGQEREINPATYKPPTKSEDRRDPDAETSAIEAEQLEDELVGCNAGSRKGGGKKKKPTGHNLTPLAVNLAVILATREQFPALCELGCRLKPCASWRDAAKAIGSTTPEALETALVGLLNARPRAFGELWFWFDLEALFEWADHPDNAGPVADGLSKLLRTDNPAQVNRLGQLLKAVEVQMLLDLLAARRAFMNMLPVLYHAHFPKLGQWLVPPTGAAALPWPSLPWSFVIVYNARHGTADSPPLGYELDLDALSDQLLRVALTTALAQAPVAVRELLIHGLSDSDKTRPVFARKPHCPFTWRV